MRRGGGGGGEGDSVHGTTAAARAAAAGRHPELVRSGRTLEYLNKHILSVTAQTVRDLLLAKDGGHLEIDTETKWESWLHKLAFRGDAEAVEVFLTRAPTLLGCRDSNGETPAHWAAKYGHLSVLQVLHKHGTDLTTTDNADNTPARLIVAAMSGAPEAVRFVTEACGAEALEAPKEEEEEEEEEDECAAFQRAESARQEQEMNARINASIQKSRQRTMDSMSEQRAFMSTLPADCSMRASLEDQHRTLRGMMGYHSMFEQMLAPSGSAPQALGSSNPFGSGPVPQTSRAGFGGGFGGGRACGGTTRPSSVVEPPEDPEEVAKAKRKRVEYEAATQSTRVAEKISRAKRLRRVGQPSGAALRRRRRESGTRQACGAARVGHSAGHAARGAVPPQ